MTRLGERLIPAFEAAMPAVTATLPLPGLHGGNVVPVDDPVAALPFGPVRRVRGRLADGVGLDLIVALTEPAAQQVGLQAGSGDDLVTALLPTVNAFVAGVAAASGSALELADVVEMGANEALAQPGAEAFTAGLFIADEQVGNVIFLAMSGALGRPQPVDERSFLTVEDDHTSANPLSLLRGVELRVTAELGRAKLPVSHVLDLGPGAVVELDRVAGSPVDVLVNGTVIAHGEVVVIDEEYGVRITEIVGSEDD